MTERPVTKIELLLLTLGIGLLFGLTVLSPSPDGEAGDFPAPINEKWYGRPGKATVTL